MTKEPVALTEVGLARAWHWRCSDMRRALPVALRLPPWVPNQSVGSRWTDAAFQRDINQRPRQCGRSLSGHMDTVVDQRDRVIDMVCGASGPNLDLPTRVGWTGSVLAGLLHYDRFLPASAR